MFDAKYHLCCIVSSGKCFFRRFVSFTCCWLLVRGCSISARMSHLVPEQWINKLSTFDCGATAREEQKTNIYAFHVDCLFDSRKLFEIGLCVCFWRDEINEKKTSFGKYCTQMANAINLHSRTFAYVIWIDLASETVRTFNLKRTSPTTSHWCNTYASIQAHRFLFAENDRAKKGIAKNAIVSAYY